MERRESVNMEWHDFFHQAGILEVEDEHLLSLLEPCFPHIRKRFTELPARPVSKVVAPEALPPRLYKVYQQLKPHILSLWERMEQVPFSGRIIEFLMTTYTRQRPCTYYIDVTEPEHTTYHNVQETCPPGRHWKLVNLATVYDARNRVYSKTLFDPFSRGIMVKHPLDNGSLCFSVCRLHFFHFAFEYHVFDFLREHIEDLKAVKRISLKQNKQKLLEEKKQEKEKKAKKQPLLGALVPSNTESCKRRKVVSHGHSSASVNWWRIAQTSRRKTTSGS